MRLQPSNKIFMSFFPPGHGSLSHNITCSVVPETDYGQTQGGRYPHREGSYRYFFTLYRQNIHQLVIIKVSTIVRGVSTVPMVSPTVTGIFLSERPPSSKYWERGACREIGSSHTYFVVGFLALLGGTAPLHWSLLCICRTCFPDWAPDQPELKAGNQTAPHGTCRTALQFKTSFRRGACRQLREGVFGKTTTRKMTHTWLHKVAPLQRFKKQKTLFWERLIRGCSHSHQMCSLLNHSGFIRAALGHCRKLHINSFAILGPFWLEFSVNNEVLIQFLHHYLMVSHCPWGAWEVPWRMLVPPECQLNDLKKSTKNIGTFSSLCKCSLTAEWMLRLSAAQLHLFLVGGRESENSHWAH